MLHDYIPRFNDGTFSKVADVGCRRVERPDENSRGGTQRNWKATTKGKG